MAKVRIIEKQEWADFLKECPNATFYHSPEWYEVWEEYAGHRIETRMIEFESGRKALLPLSWMPAVKGLFKVYQSSPAGTYGGIVTKEKLSYQEEKEVRNIIAKLGNFQIIENPFAFNKNILQDKNDPIFFTQTIQLDTLENNIIGNIKSSKRRQFRNAEKNFIKIKKLQNKDIDHLYFLYQKRKKEWEYCSNDYSLNIFEILNRKRKVDFWGVYIMDKLISGACFFSYNNHVSYWFGVSDSAYFKYYPSVFLHYKLILYYKQKGFKIFDFNPSGGYDGVVQFKRGFGAEKIIFPVWNHQSKALKLISHFRDIVSKSNSFF